MRRLNVRFLICLIVPVILAAGGVHLLWAVNVERSTQHILTKAKSAMEEGDLNRALRHYMRYLLQNPRDVDEICTAALAAADIFDQSERPTQRELRSAYEFMSRAVRKAPERDDIRRRLVLLMVKANINDEARRHVEYLESAGKSDPEMDYSYAICAFRMNDYKAAQDRLYRIVGFDTRQDQFDVSRASDPAKLEAYQVLAATRRDNPKQADRYMEQMLTANPDSAKAHLEMARYLRVSNLTGTKAERDDKNQRVGQFLRKAMELEGTNTQVLLENALLALGANEFDKAKKMLDEVEVLDPQDLNVPRLKGMLEFRRNNPEAGLAEYEKGLERMPDQVHLIWLKYQAQMQTGDYDAGRTTIERMKVIEDYPAVRIEFAEAQVKVVEREWKAAAEMLEKVRPVLKGDAQLSASCNMMLAQCYQRLGKIDEEMNAYKRALTNSPGLQTAAQGYISALIRLQQFEEAYQRLRESRTSLGQKGFESNQQLLGFFYDVVLQLLRSRPGDTQLKQDFEYAQKALTRLPEERVDEDDNDQIARVLVKVNELVRQGNYKETLRVLTAAIRKTPKNQRLRKKFLEVHAQTYGSERTKRLLGRVLKDGDSGWIDNASTRTILIEFVVKSKEPDKGEQLAELEVGIDQFDKQQQFQVWRALGSAYSRVQPQDFDAVQRCWRNALEIQPTDIRIVEQLFELARLRNNDLGLATVISHVDKEYGENSAESMYFHGKQLLWNYYRDRSDEESLESAANISQRLMDARSGWYLSALLSAEVNDLQNRSEPAIRDYQNALKLGPPRASAVQRLVELLIKEGKYREARQELAKLNPLPAELRKYKVLLEAVSGSPKVALEALQDAVNPKSTNSEDWLWMGQVLRQLKRPSDATKAYTKAILHGQSIARTWLTMVDHLVQNGQSPLAENYARDAENALSVDKAPLALAQAYAILGDHELAEHYYDAALTASDDDPATIRTIANYYYSTRQPRKGEEYVKRLLRILDRSGPSSSPHAIWARRTLARAMGREKDYGRFVTALAILDANRIDGQLSVADQLIRAELMGRRDEPHFREQAVQAFERLQAENVPISRHHRLILAVLYDKSDRWVQADGIMTALVSETGDRPNPDLLADFAQMLLARKEYPRADTWIQKLSKIEKTNYRTVRLRALSAMGYNGNDEARRVINEWIPKNPAPADAPRVLRAAALFEELELNADAEEMYRQFTELRPDRFEPYAGFLARSGQIDRAIELCKSKKSDKTIRSITGVGILALLEYPREAKAHFSTVQNWYDSARTQNPADTSLVLNWASVLHTFGKNDEAKDIVEAALSTDLSRRHRGILINNIVYFDAVQGNVDENTLRLVKTAEELMGSHPDVLDSRAMIYLGKGDCAKAIKDLEDATMFGADSGILYFHLALAYKCTNERSAANLAMEKAKDAKFAKRRLSQIELDSYHELATWLRR